MQIVQHAEKLIRILFMQTFLIVGLLASRAAEVAELPHHQAALGFKPVRNFSIFSCSPSFIGSRLKNIKYCLKYCKPIAGIQPLMEIQYFCFQPKRNDF